MNINQFKSSYYLERQYQQVSEIEFYCRLVVKSKQNNQEVTGIETKINTLQIGQGLSASHFSFHPINWENYLNQTITMLFNMLMLSINLVDIYNVDGQEKIANFFNENPFHDA